MDHCNLCDERFSSRKRVHNCLDNHKKNKAKKRISNPPQGASHNPGISPDLQHENFIKETIERNMFGSFDGTSNQSSSECDSQSSEGEIERGTGISPNFNPENFTQEMIERIICGSFNGTTNQSSPGTGISPDLQHENSIKETSEGNMCGSFDRTSNQSSSGCGSQSSEGEIQRGRVRYEMKSNNIDLKTICLACLKTGVNLRDHPVVKGGICELCSVNWLLGTNYKNQTRKNCFICGEKRKIFICSNATCVYDSVFCEVCISEYYPPSILQSRKDWVCIFCDPSGSDILELQIWMKKRYHASCKRIINMQSCSSAKNKIVIKHDPIRILSLFDGIGSGFVSLRKLGIVIEDYYASEIDEDAIRVANVQSGGKIKQLGDVRALNTECLSKLGRFDLLIGGSPCTDLSLVNPARRGLYDTESTGMLFFEFVRILKILKSQNQDILFLFENTAAMTNNVKEDISRYLDCQPVLLDSKIFCPMKRARYFWGNIHKMNDFSDLPSKEHHLKSFLTESCGRAPLVQCIRTMTTNFNSMRQGPNQQLPVMMNGSEDSLWITEMERLFGFDEHYTDVGNISITKRHTLLGNSWCIPVICYLLRGLRLGFPTNSSVKK